MEKREDSLVVSLVSSKSVKACVSVAYKEELTNQNGASSSSSRHINIDLNELPSDHSGKEEPESSVSIKIDHLNEIPCDSGKEESKSSVSIKIDLNEIPSDSENEEPQTPPYISSPSKNPPNPNSKPYTSSNKRPLVRRHENKKEKKLRREALSRSPPPTPEWLLQVMSTMNRAEDARLIYEKTLFKSDVNPSEGRLLVSFEDLIRNDFLTQAESTTSVWEGMKTIVKNQRSEQWSLVFKRWVMKKKNSPNGGNNYYVLNCGWNDVVNGNRLKDGDKISLWSFRCQGALCFALSTLPPTLEESSSSATT